MLARQRRRLAAAALAGSLAAGPSAALAQPRHAGRALALVLRALEDEPAFQVRACQPCTGRQSVSLSAPWRWCSARTSRVAQMHGALSPLEALKQAPATTWSAVCMRMHEHAPMQGHANRLCETMLSREAITLNEAVLKELLRRFNLNPQQEVRAADQPMGAKHVDVYKHLIKAWLSIRDT